MKHAIHLALASMAAFVAGSVQAGHYTTFTNYFDGMTLNAAPASTAAGTWALHANDDGTVVATNGNSNVDYLLSLACATNTPVVFTPVEETNLLEMDVNFVGASEDQLPEAGSQVGLYLDVSDSSNPVLKLSVNGGAFVDFTDDTSGTAVSVTEGFWYKVVMEFDYTTPKTVVKIYQGNSLLGTKTTTGYSTSNSKVNSVNFCGTGLVDNFVGKFAFESATTAGGAETDSDVAMTISGSTLTPAFAPSNANGALKFITVTDVEGKTHTLRYTGSQAFNTTGLGKVSKVVAYYGNSVSATDGVTVAPTNAVVNGTVSGGFEAASGLYYAIEKDGVKSALNDNEPVAPENDGKPLSYTVIASDDDYGVVKFKIVASDDPVPAQQ